jgi:hypothetical protein
MLKIDMCIVDPIEISGDNLSGHYKNVDRTAVTAFEFLLNRIAPSITKQSTFLRKSIPIYERLAFDIALFGLGRFLH